jgi:hypothetical protein
VLLALSNLIHSYCEIGKIGDISNIILRDMALLTIFIAYVIELNNS